MKLLGLLLTVCGWLVPVVGLTLTSSLAMRLVLSVLGITMCLVGILGFLNGAYQKQAVWKK